MRNILLRIANPKLKVVKISFLVLGIFILNACKKNVEDTGVNEVISEIEDITVVKQFLIGSWKDTSQAALDFTLFENGTAQSDNMKTLLYKNWSVKGNQLTFIVESIGNHNSSVDTIAPTIEKLTNDELILLEGTNRVAFAKVKK